MTADQNTFKLVSFDLCPFVQRSVITLEEKGCPYDIDYIDLGDKPSWFLEISPFGRVPVLIVEREGKKTVLFESAVINEYLDEATPGARLLPADPLEKARCRAWIEFTSSMIGSVYRLQVAPDKDKAMEAADEIKSKFDRLEGALARTGAFFLGTDFSLVDAAAAPALQRMAWCESYVPGLGLFEGNPRVAAWWHALVERPSVRESTVEDIEERFKEYLRGRGSPTRRVEPSWIGRQLKDKVLRSAQDDEASLRVIPGEIRHPERNPSS